MSLHFVHKLISVQILFKCFPLKRTQTFKSVRLDQLKDDPGCSHLLAIITVFDVAMLRKWQVQFTAELQHGSLFSFILFIDLKYVKNCTLCSADGVVRSQLLLLLIQLSKSDSENIYRP